MFKNIVAKYHIYTLLLILYERSTAATYSLSLHDALPIFGDVELLGLFHVEVRRPEDRRRPLAALERRGDRKSTRLNSSHQIISYAVFCLKKKNHSRRWNRY